MNTTPVGPAGCDDKVNVVVKLPAVATTTMLPAADPAVTTVDAWPFVPVLVDEVPRDALPLLSVNVTGAPLTGFPEPSTTSTTKGAAKAVPTRAVWLLPETC